MAELVVRSAGIRKFWVRIPFAIFIKKNHLEFLSKQLFSNIVTSVQTLKTSNLFNVDVRLLYMEALATWQNRTLLDRKSPNLQFDYQNNTYQRVE